MAHTPHDPSPLESPSPRNGTITTVPERVPRVHRDAPPWSPDLPFDRRSSFDRAATDSPSSRDGSNRSGAPRDRLGDRGRHTLLVAAATAAIALVGGVVLISGGPRAAASDPPDAAAAGDGGEQSEPSPETADLGTAASAGVDEQRTRAACAEDGTGRGQAVQLGTGAGPVHALLGDSLGSQIRRTLKERTDARWLVASQCGARLAWPMQAGTLDAVLWHRPSVLVIALGENDTADDFSQPAPSELAARLLSLEALLDRTDHVECRLVVNLAASDRSHSQPNASMFVALAWQVNDRIARIDPIAHPNVYIADWQRVVVQDASTLQDDRLHLTHHGIDARVELIERTIAEECPRRPVVEPPPTTPVSVNRVPAPA